MSDQSVMERYAAMPGRYFDDFNEGDIYHHLPGRTISQQDNAWFTLLTMNTHPLHFDEEYAAATEFGKAAEQAYQALADEGHSARDFSVPLLKLKGGL